MSASEQQQQQHAAPQPSAADRAAAEKAEKELNERRAAASIGAQVILDFNEAASLGARGGAGGDIVANSMVRDEYLVRMGFDPASPSGPPPTAEMIAAKRQREEAAAKAAAEGPFLPPKASRVSSLAAGLDTTPPEAPQR